MPLEKLVFLAPEEVERIDALAEVEGLTREAMIAKLAKMGAEVGPSCAATRSSATFAGSQQATGKEPLHGIS